MNLPDSAPTPSKAVSRGRGARLYAIYIGLKIMGELKRRYSSTEPLHSAHLKKATEITKYTLAYWHHACGYRGTQLI
jgi:hypothetical protein